MGGVLQGIRVLDFGTAIAGAYASMLLGDLGAEILKIEPVPASEPLVTDLETGEITPWIANHWAMNRSKKSLCLDMKQERGRAVFLDLLAASDVVFDNFRPHVLPRLGIDYETLKEHNPRIVSCSVSGFGDDGPWRDLPSFDLIAQAMGGTMSITGEPGRMPIRCGVPIGDLTPAIFAALGIVSALLGRTRSGLGQRMDISMFDVQLALQAYRVPQVFGLGAEPGPQPRRSGSAGQVPYGPYRTQDGRWIAIAGGAVQFWRQLCKAVGREDLAADPRYETAKKRQQCEEELSAIFEQAFATRTADEWESVLMEAGIPAAKVNTIREAFEHPQAQARNMLRSFDHPFGRRMKVAANPIKIRSMDDREEYDPAPGLGEHTREILRQVAGYSDDQLAALREVNAIWWPEKGLSFTRDFERYA